MINILLVDDHDLVRSGIRHLLEETPGIRVIDEVSNGEKAIVAVKQKHPDVIIMDLNMPGIGGFETTRRLLSVDGTIKIVVLTVYKEEPYPTRLLRAGALGYLTKGCSVEEMVNAVRTVYFGRRYISAEVAQNMALEHVESGTRSPFDELSHREIQIMVMVANGLKVSEISDQLCLSPKTVNTYRYRLFDKLKIKNNVELTHLAARYNFVDISAIDVVADKDDQP